ncbi:MAG: hypothetical protein ACLPKI_11105 [Streptosporangiaceae bacterium]
MRRFGVILAAVPLAGLAVAAPASAGATQIRQVGSCTAQGDYATCDASGTVNRPRELIVHGRSTPGQQVSVYWSMTCAKGMGAGSKSGQFTATTPLHRVMKMPYRHPDWCSVAAGAQLSDGGHLRVWITAVRK